MEPRTNTMYPPTNNQDFATSPSSSLGATRASWRPSSCGTSRTWARTARIAPDEPRAYAEMVKAATRALKQASPNLPVLAGALAYGNDAWVRGMYAAGIKGHYDGLAIHPYHDGAPRPGSWGGIEWARRLQREAGDTAPLWLTEFGWSTCRIGSGWCVTPADQARSSPPSPPRAEPNVKEGIV